MKVKTNVKAGRRGRGRDDGPGHVRHGRGADDGLGHRRHVGEHGPFHT
jgi:hypothetical protein